MILKKFYDLPDEFRNDTVYTYYKILKKKKISIVLKRLFDFFVSLVMLIVMFPVLLIIGIAIRLDSDGPAIFKQNRVTKYGRIFNIYKFRTMYGGSDKGSQVTVSGDSRITGIGGFLRKYRLDELPQLVNILKGDMSFVGTRPEVKKYVDCYSDEMYATLLLPAGVTSLASIYYKDEAKLLDGAADIDEVYVEHVLPGKMHYNLKAIDDFSFWSDIRIMFMTVFAVLGKEYKGDYIEQTPAKEDEVNV